MAETNERQAENAEPRHGSVATAATDNHPEEMQDDETLEEKDPLGYNHPDPHEVDAYAATDADRK